MAVLKIEDLLEDLADDGLHESSGSFTLDPKKAEEKLRGFSFASPHHYLLKLLQCAVAGGATQVLISTAATEIRIEFDGEAMQAEDLEGLMGYLLNESVSIKLRRYRHLAAALRGAAALNPKAVTFDFSTGSSRVRRVWDEQGWRLSKSPLGNIQGRHVFLLDRTLVQTLSAAKAELSSVFGSGDTPEESVLRGRCRYAPCSIVLDGEQIPLKTFGEARYPGYDISSDPHPGESRPPPYISNGILVDKFMAGGHHLIEQTVSATQKRPGNLPLPESRATVSIGRPESGLCCAWFAITAQLSTPRLIYVEDGVVLLESDDHGIQVPGFLAVLSSVALQKDLTGFQLVKDQKFRQTQQWVSDQARVLRETLLEKLELFPNRDRIEAALK